MIRSIAVNTEDVYKDDDERRNCGELKKRNKQESHEESDSFVEAKKEETHDYKKRYDDLETSLRREGRRVQD